MHQMFDAFFTKDTMCTIHTHKYTMPNQHLNENVIFNKVCVSVYVMHKVLYVIGIVTESNVCALDTQNATLKIALSSCLRFVYRYCGIL